MSLLTSWVSLCDFKKLEIGLKLKKNMSMIGIIDDGLAEDAKCVFFGLFYKSL